MNKQEREILERLFWYVQQHKNDHHILYTTKEILQSVLRGEYRIARDLIEVIIGVTHKTRTEVNNE